MQAQESNKQKQTTRGAARQRVEQRWLGTLIWRGLTVALGYVVAACANGPEIVDHTFAFDALRDSPGIQVLDYRYGDSRLPGASNPGYIRREGRSLQRTGITGPMRKGESLYVKWRTLPDNKIYEETVDLRRRLPKDITDCELYFVITGPQLYVYLVLPQRRPPNVAPNGPRQYHDRYVLTIYPDRH